MNREAMYDYVGETVPIDLIGEAWLVLSNPDDGDGKGNVVSDELGYLADDWSKAAKRTIRGFAEANPRPGRWPWADRRFDIFEWRRP